METHSIKSRCYRTAKKNSLQARSSIFQPEHLHAGTVKGLIIIVMATTVITINVFLTISVVSHLPVALMATTTTVATTREIRTFMMAHFWLLQWFGCSFSTDTTETVVAAAFIQAWKERRVLRDGGREERVREEKLKNGLYLPSIKQVLNHVKTIHAEVC